jgi:hypothetical protein
MQLKPGMRLRSQVCMTEVVVVRPAADELDITCGGESMVAIDVETVQGRSPAAGLDEGTQLGKRYTTGELESTLELLVTKAGAGTLAADGTPLVVKQAKQLPASD